MPARLNVVVSQSRSQNPKKRAIEERIVGELLGSPGIDVAVVPHLYDLKSDGPGILSLSGMTGNIVLCSWLYPRAARWTLDRNGICGQEGTTLLKSLGEDEETDEEQPEEDEKQRVIESREVPQRKIYCL
ncbi:MAG: ferredoxin family protein, partial [Lacipirellulaceae bacterium]